MFVVELDCPLEFLVITELYPHPCAIFCEAAQVFGSSNVCSGALVLEDAIRGEVSGWMPALPHNSQCGKRLANWAEKSGSRFCGTCLSSVVRLSDKTLVNTGSEDRRISSNTASRTFTPGVNILPPVLSAIPDSACSPAMCRPASLVIGITKIP